MINTFVIFLSILCYLAVGCAVSIFAFIEEWHHRRNLWQTTALIVQIALLMLVWPFAVAAVAVYAAVDR